MFNALILRPNDDLPPAVMRINYDSVKEILGGAWVELMSFGHAGMYLDEDGKSKRLARNNRATRLARKWLGEVGRVLLPDDYVSGIGVVTGFRIDAEEGLISCDLPDKYLEDVAADVRIYGPKEIHGRRI